MGVKVREKPKNSGNWWIFIDHQGRRKAKKIGRDKKAALEVAKKIEAKLTLGDMGLIENNKPTANKFDEYAQTWIKLTVPATCKTSSIGDYEGILKNHVLPVFGKTPVTDINKLMVKSFLMKKIASGFASSTVTHMKNAVSGVLNLAIDDEIIQTNPAHNIGKIFKKQNQKPIVDPFSPIELAIVLDTYQKHFSRHYPFIMTMARTGIRFGEGLGLQWKDIDFKERFINIERSLTKGRVETPKNGRDRKVDMSRQLTDILIGLKHARKMETLKNGWGMVPDWVFVTNDGNPYHESYLRRVFYRALQKADLRKIRVHDLRHTYATLRIAKGDNVADISKQLGHHSVKFTMDVYYHWMPGGSKKEVDGLDDMVSDATIRNLSATKKKGASRGSD